VPFGVWGGLAMMQSAFSWSALREYIRTFLYREIRDVYYGLPKHPRWFLMRKIARFESIKSLVSSLRHRLAHPDSMPDISQPQNSLFQGINIDRVVGCLRKDGVFVGLNLPIKVVEQIVQFSKDVYCYGKNKPEWGFYYDEKDVAIRKLNIKLLTADYITLSLAKLFRWL
jgi:hypothetical protein